VVFHLTGSKIKIPGNVGPIDRSPFVDVSLIAVSQDEMRFRLRECFLEDFDGLTIYRYSGFVVQL
jgi:hypothetical protein